MGTSGRSRTWAKLQKEIEQGSSGSVTSLETPAHLSIEPEINENRHLLFSTIHYGRHLRSHDPFLKISAAANPSLVKMFAEALFDDLGISEPCSNGQDIDGLTTVAENILDPVEIAYTPYDKRLMMTPISFSCRKLLMDAADSNLVYSEQQQSRFGSMMTAADDLMGIDEAEVEFKAPILSTVNAHGVEGIPIPLQIGASSMNIFAEDRLLFEISNVPEDAILSEGHNDGHGVWTVSYDQLNQLCLISSKYSDQKIDLLIKASAFGDQGQMAVSVAHLLVEVDPAVVVPVEVASDSVKEKDYSIPLTTDASLVGSVDDLFIITGVPVGATLSAGCDQGGGAWLLSATQLQGLTLTPPQDFFGDFNIRVQVIPTELDGKTPIATQDISFCVNADRHGKSSRVKAEKNKQFDDVSLKKNELAEVELLLIPIQIEIELQDPNHEELICVVISGVPEGSYFPVGINNNDGSWTLLPVDLEGLTWTPSPGFSGKVDLTVEAIVEDLDGNSFSVTQVLPIQIVQ